MGVRVKLDKHKPGRWWVRVNHHGRRKSLAFNSKKAADVAAVKIDAALKLGDIGLLDPLDAPARVQTVAEYAEPWLKSLTKPQAVTVEAYRLRLNVHILPLIGHLSLTDLTRERVRALISELMAGGNRRAGKDAEGRRRPLARGTLKGLLNILSGLLERAVEDGLLLKNPARGLARELPASATAAEVEEIEVFTPDELKRLLGTAERDYPEWYAFVLCLARSGVRLGEAVALEWRDVDFDRRMLLIRRSERRGRVSVPKNGKARRVEMSRQLARALADRKSFQEAEAALAGHPAPARVFLTPGTARPIRDDAWRNNVWTPMVRRAGLRYRKPHTLRHTFASLLIEGGESLKYVQEQLGHHSPAFTLAVYGHLLPRGERRAVDRLDDASDATFRNPRATEHAGPGSLISETEEIHGEVSLPAH
jgi:integrase